MDGKSWYRSKTLWLNLVAAALVAAEASMGALTAVLPGDAYAWLAVGVPVANALLRVITTQPIIRRGAE